MNNNGTILVGALIGAGIGYLVADWYIETYIPEEGFELEEQPDQIEKFEKRLARKEATVNLTRTANKVGVVRNYSEFFRKEERPDLAALAAKYAGDDIDEFSEEQALAENGLLEDDDETEEMTDDSNDPCIISVEEYATDDEFTHTTLRYYSDDVLVDENDIPINRPEKFLPENALVSFGELSQDPDIVYVRNSEKRAMYEIVQVDKPYASVDTGRPRRSNKLDYIKAKKEMGNVTGEDN